MYVLVQHNITDPPTFWSAADTSTLPPALKLHHTFAGKDGTHAVCLWEVESVDALRAFLEPATAQASRNEYFEVENKEGFATPSRLHAARAMA